MKANELMTGDYFRIAQTCKIIKIVAVDDNSGCVDYFDGDAGGMLTIGVEKIQPIPLTAEILEKNGFIESDVFVEWKYEDEGLYILWKPFPFLKVETQSVQLNLSGCEYIYELQHVLRLCGIDKQITI